MTIKIHAPAALHLPNSSWLYREDKDLSTLPGMEPRVLELPTRVLVTVNTELFRLVSVNIFRARTATEGSTSATLQELRIGIMTLKMEAHATKSIIDINVKVQKRQEHFEETSFQI
jgi:hypothetical protein